MSGVSGMNGSTGRLNNLINLIDVKSMLAGAIVSGVFLYFPPKVAFAVTLGVIVFIYLVERPDYAILAAIATLPFEMVGRITSTSAAVPLSLSKVFGVVTFVSLVWNILTVKRRISIPMSFIFIAGIAVIALVDYRFVAINKEKAIAGIQRIAVTIGFYFLIIQLVDSREMLKKAVWVITLALIFAAGASIAQRFGNVLSYEQAATNYGNFYGSVLENLDASHFIRTTGFYADPDIFAFALLIPAGVILYQLKQKSRGRWERIFLIASLMAVAGGLISSHSRTGLIGMGVLVFVMLARVVKPRLSTVAIYGIAACIAAAPFVPSSFWARIKSISDTKASYTSNARITIYKDGFSMFKDNWVLGVGVDNFPANFEKYTQSDIRPAGTMNLYLQLAAEFGLFGLIFFLLTVGEALRKIWRLRKNLIEAGDTENYQLLTTIENIIIAMLVCGLTIHTMERKEMWLILAIPAAAANILASGITMGRDSMPLRRPSGPEGASA